MVRATSSNVLPRITTLLIICCLLTVGLCVNTAAALPGSGTQQDPWRIESLADFDEFVGDANYWDDYTRLETDVNLAGRTYSTAVIAPDVNNSRWGFQGTAFTGVFDGNDHKIINLTVDDGVAGKDFLGLFGYIGQDGQVNNLGIEGGSVSGSYYVGGLVAYNTGSVSNCYSTGDVSGDFEVGGIAGRNGGSVSNCYSTGDVSSNREVGGLVGINSGSVSNCYSTSDVSATDNSMGGLVGINSGSISNCYSTGFVSGTGSCGGAMVGQNWGSVSNCYSTGDVNGTGRYIGGLVGLNGDSISNCYSTGDVNGDRYVGGLVGDNQETGSVSNCFWDTDTQTHGVTESIGLNEGTVTNVAGLSTAQMQTKSTFTDAGWDFVEIWLINNGATYPVLRQEIRSDLNGVGGVDMLDFAIFADHWLEGKDE
jgi:hypothetical protein